VIYRIRPDINSSWLYLQSELFDNDLCRGGELMDCEGVYQIEFCRDMSQEDFRNLPEHHGW
jgi:hypothetical protein